MILPKGSYDPPAESLIPAPVHTKSAYQRDTNVNLVRFTRAELRWGWVNAAHREADDSRTHPPLPVL